MGATWIAKPVKALSAGEIEDWYGLDWGPNLAPSQTPDWGLAGIHLGVEPILVFSPERRISALFLRSGTEAECVNGPVYDWSCNRTAAEQNELIGMTVHALIQCRPNITRVTLRPRLQEKDLDSFLEKSAFPTDGVDRSSTLRLKLDTPEEGGLFESLGSRIRHEVRRAIRDHSRAEHLDAKMAIDDFWNRCSSFYTKKNLWLPSREWIHQLLARPDSGALLIRAIHEPSQSTCELLAFPAGRCVFNLFAAESRSTSCPNLSLNALAQWEAMRAFRARGYRTYDLNGISNPGSHDPEFQGVDTYKRKFKGELLQFAHPLLRFG